MDNTFRISKKTIVFSYITQFLLYGSSIIIMPFILSFLEGKILGVWYIFIAIASISSLIDFGFSSALSRNISFAFSGAKEIIKEGSPSMEENGELNFSLISSLLYTSKKVYFIIALIIMILLCSAGTLYIFSATKEAHINNILPLWITYSFSVSINYYYNYVNVFIRGRGMISLSNKVIIINKLSYIIITLSLFYCGLNLWALVISTFISSLTGNFYGLYCFYDKQFRIQLNQFKEEKKINYYPIIWHNAKKFGLASFTNYAFSQASILIAGTFLPLNQTAQLGLTLQVSSIIVTISRVYFNSYYPRICSLWVKNDIKQIKSIFIKSQIVGYLFWLIGFGLLLSLGNVMLDFIHSKTLLPDPLIILMYALFNLMELTHGNCSMLISSRNSVPFLKAAIWACFISVILMYLLSYWDWGMIAFPSAIILANLPYNSWKWVTEAYRLLKEN